MTAGGVMILGKLVLTFGVLIGIPLFELLRLRRMRGGDHAEPRRTR